MAWGWAMKLLDAVQKAKTRPNPNEFNESWAAGSSLGNARAENAFNFQMSPHAKSQIGQKGRIDLIIKPYPGA